MNNHFEFMHYRARVGAVSGRKAPRGATVAIHPLEGRNTALISIAQCGSNDNFSKKIGRSIAAGRLIAYLQGREEVAKYVREVPLDESGDLKPSVAQVLFQEMDDKDLV